MQTDVMSNKRNLILPSPVSSLEVSPTIETESSVVIVGSNGSGKTRLESWIDRESPQKSLVHRVGAQKSLLIPDFCSTSSIDISENTLLYGLHQPNVSSLGGRGMVSEDLYRKRSLTLEMIRKLNQELGIPAEILIQPYKSVKIPA